MPMYGDGGYVYGPGTCDCPPPCIGHLWTFNPKRCHNHHLLSRHCGCNSCDGCCGTSRPLHGMLVRIFGHGCCDSNSCTSSVSCGCAAPTCTTSAPSCTAAADCGCKPVCGKCRPCHLGLRVHGSLELQLQLVLVAGELWLCHAGSRSSEQREASLARIADTHAGSGGIPIAAHLELTV